MELFKRLLSDRANVEAFNEKRFQTFCNEFVSLKTLYPKQKYILDKDIGHVKIIHRDENYVEYFVKVKIDFYHKYGSLYEISEHSFPEVKNKELFSDEKSIKYIHKKFMNYAESLKSFYDIIGRIDTICWILDPPNATSKHVQRRIVIGTKNFFFRIIDLCDFFRGRSFDASYFRSVECNCTARYEIFRTVETLR